jgi:RNA polymerase sigma-70 factor (ECF subfamily)
MEAVEAIALERARAGDEDSFRMLVEQHSHKMFRLAYRMTGNEADAEDVVQETFLRAYRKIGSYDSRAKFSSWLHTIASNYAIDILRRRKRWRPADLESLERHAPLKTDEPGPDRSAFGGEIRLQVEKELEKLSPRERIAFTLRHYEGMSIEEIGRIMGIRRGAAKNHVFRAVRKLRAALEPVVGKGA